MNNLVYGNQQPAKLAAGVEEIVRKDVGSSTPLPCRALDVAAGSASFGSVLVDVANVLGSGATTTLLTLEIDLPAAHPATLRAHVIRQGVGAYCGSLLYAIQLGKPVAGEVGIEDHKSFGTPKLTGNPDAAGRLNTIKDLAKRIDKVLRTETDMGSIKVRGPRLFSVRPGDAGAVLVLGTLPRLTSMGMSATTDAREVLEIAAAIDAAL